MYLKFFKRFIDIVLSGIGLVVLIVPMLIVAAVIRCEDPGPVIFKQKRVVEQKINGFNIVFFKELLVFLHSPPPKIMISFA